METYISSPGTEETTSQPTGVCGEPHPGGAQATRESLLDAGTAQTLAGIFRALSDPTRLRIISALAERELCVSDLTAALDMEQPAVSHQLAGMRGLQLVRSRREGRHIYYRLDDEHVRDLFAQGLAHVRHR